MDRQYFLDLAEQGLRTPIGTELVLREKTDAESILCEGHRLGEVVIEAAQRYRTPLAFGVMDLTLEKAWLMHLIGLEEDPDTFQFHASPTDQQLDRMSENLEQSLPPPRAQATIAAVRHVAQAGAELLPIGMSIGPVSLMTRLLSDPITPIFMAGSGTTAEEDEEVRGVESVLEMATRMVLHSVRMQIDAGARAVLIAEPAANKAYFSPNQLRGDGDVWHRYVTASNRRVTELLTQHGVDLIFHCCGELNDEMVRRFGQLSPAILSLGSSRSLPDDARLVSAETVLYGNLPSKKFYADEEITPEQVAQMTCALVRQMNAAHHPFILGSECDVLSVSGCHATIAGKVDVMLNTPSR